MASEVMNSKSQSARIGIAENLSEQKAGKNRPMMQGAGMRQDFLAALDKAGEKDVVKPKTANRSKSLDKAQDFSKNQKKSETSEARDLSRVKAPAPKPRLQEAAEKSVRNVDPDRGTMNQRARHDDKRKTNDSLEDQSEEKAQVDSSPNIRDLLALQKKSIEDTPVVAFLTGHLEKLDASQIPSLVAGSDFVQAALSEPDIEQFMQQPMKAIDLFKSLGLSEDLVSAAFQGLDLEQVVTPQKFFDDLGVDPQRVSVELQLLRGNLGLGDVSSYMERARTLASINDPSGIGPRLSEEKLMDQNQFGRTGTAWTPQTHGTAKNMAPFEGQGVVDAKFLGNMSAGDKTQSGGHLIQSDSVNHLAGEALNDDFEDLASIEDGAQSLAYVLAAQDWLRHLSPGIGGPQKSSEVVSEDGVSGAIPWSMALEKNSLIQGEISQAKSLEGPTTHRATYDAWKTLGDTLRGLDTQTFDSNQTIGSVESMLGRDVNSQGAGGQSSDAVLRAPWLVIQESKLEKMSPTEVETSFKGIRPAAAGFEESTGNTLAGQAFSVPEGGKPLSLKSSFLSDAMKAAIKDIVTDVSGPNGQVLADVSPRDGQGFGNKERGGEERESRGYRDDTVVDGPTLKGPAFETPRSKPVDIGFTEGLSQSSSEPRMTPAQRTHLVQQVIDRATILSRQGGGSMRVDLSSADLGRMELAVALDDDRVDLRVLAGSEGIRSALLSDMTRLRDALGLQNIQLGQVEVGVAGRDPMSSGQGFAGQGFAGQGSSDQRREFARDELFRPVSRVGGLSKLNRGAAIEASQPIGASSGEPILGNGRIALRV